MAIPLTFVGSPGSHVQLTHLLKTPDSHFLWIYTAPDTMNRYLIEASRLLFLSFFFFFFPPFFCAMGMKGLFKLL